MATKGAWRAIHPRTDWDSWKWVGGQGGGYSFNYREADMDAVPEWVQRIVNTIGIDERIATAEEHLCLELVGKKYIYRLVPELVEQGCAVVTILRREKPPRSDIPQGKSTAKGSWRSWNSKLSSSNVRQEWRQKGWQPIGEVKWHPAGFTNLYNRLFGGNVNCKLVPKWVQDEFSKRLNDDGAPVSHARAPIYYELKGKKYSYLIMPKFIVSDTVLADVFSKFRKSSS